MHVAITNASLWARLAIIVSALFCGSISAQESESVTATEAQTGNKDDTPSSALSTDQWRRVDSSVDRALAFLASQQQSDGSFPTQDHGQPAVTSLCVLAFMAHGHHPGTGIYGDCLDRAIEFIVACQKPNGLIALVGPDTPELSRDIEHKAGVAATYNHAISGLTLSEMYGMRPSNQSERIQKLIAKAVTVTLELQQWPKDGDHDRGGWRYLHDYDQTDSDLSVTGWQLMFLRSARNAGFSVPKESINDAVEYIRRTFHEGRGTFVYRVRRGDGRSRGMAGAGILALAHAGHHNSPEARSAAQFVLQHNFDLYNDSQPYPTRDRYHYSLFMCCQGMYQIGNPYWEQFFPRTVNAVLPHQQPDGSWDAESFERDQRYGNSYTTALVVLALGAPNQLLPIFQR
jgi:hypothetical protein